MNTAAPSRKKLLSLVLTLVFMLTCLPAALAVDLNVDAGFYFKQSRGGTCTLASAAMMLRRRAYFDGLTDWSAVTENSVRSTAWSNGLSHSFTYKEMQVGYGTLPSRKQEKVQTLITLLSQHPEGIVLYDRGQPHAVLLTDYTNGNFYCSDPAGNISSGRIPLENSSVSVNRSSCYWYVASDHNSIAAEADGLRLEGMSYPINVRAGKGMALTGTANACAGHHPDQCAGGSAGRERPDGVHCTGGTQYGDLLLQVAGQLHPLWRTARRQLHLHGDRDRFSGR